MILRKLKIGTRLAIGFGAIMLVMVGLALGSLWVNKVSRDRLAATLAEAGAKEQLAIEMKGLALELSSSLRNLVILPDLEALGLENERIRSLQGALDTALTRMAGLEIAAHERQVVMSIRGIDAEFDGPSKEAYELATHFRTEDVRAHVRPRCRCTTSRMDGLGRGDAGLPPQVARPSTGAVAGPTNGIVLVRKQG